MTTTPDAAISDMVVDAMVADLQEMAATISNENETWGAVKGGRLQDNPLKYDIYICVHIGDPEDPNSWLDGLVANTKDALDRREFRIPAMEVGGGGKAWWRRFTIEFAYYGIKTKTDRDESRRITDITRGRISQCLARSKRIPGLRDMFGECVGMSLEVSSGIFEGGGPPKSFIWRGKIRWQIMTQRQL